MSGGGRVSRASSKYRVLMSINAVLPLLKLSQHRYAAQLAARLRQHTPTTTLVGILPAGRLHLGVGGRVLLVVICIRDDAAGQVALRGGQADPRPLAGHQNRKSVFPEFSEALGGPVVEVDVAGIVRSLEAPVKEAPRSWSPNPPYFNAERHELNVVKAFSPPPHHCSLGPSL